MAWDKLRSRADIAAAYETIPSPQKMGVRDYRLPPTTKSDFKRFLMHDTESNHTFEQIRNWYDQSEHIYIRAQQTAIDWKSKIGNSDMSTNFKTDHDIPIRKGDMVIREDGTIYLLNWSKQIHENNQASQSSECNAACEFTRHVPEITDERGMQIQEEHDEVIAPLIPLIHSEYAGRPDYAAAQGTPGINADHLITVNLQWNEKTKNIRIKDSFELGCFTYRVINISIVEIDITGEYGVLTLNAKRVAGGGLEDE